MKALQLTAKPRRPGGNRSANAGSFWTHPVVRLVDLDKPRPAADEILLQVAYCGLCGSDFHLAEPGRESEILYPGLLELPVVLGHEFSGRVVDYGPSVSESTRERFPLGALVTAEEMQWCGLCDPCRSGQPNHCSSLEEIGFTRNGAHAEFVAVNARHLWSLTPLEARFGAEEALRLGAMVEPYAVSYRALFQGAQGNRWLPGSKVVVLGAGPIGLAALDLARASGALEVAVVEPRNDRRALAQQLGASQCHRSHAEISLTECDWVIDAAGAAQEAVEVAARHLAIGGSLCFLARTDAPATVWPEMLITKNARIFGSQGHSGEGTFRRVIDLMAANLLHPLKMLDGVCSLQEAADRLSHQRRGSGKILVRPH